MSITKLYTLYGVNINTADSVDLFISQITSQNFSANIEEILEFGDGVVDPTFAAILRQNPKIAFTSTKVASILGTIGIGGLEITADVDDDGCEFWFQKIQSGGTRATGSSHMKLTMAKGMIFLRSITASNDRIATADMEAIALYDGTNNPFVVALNQALEGSVGSSEGFVAGPVSINGTTIEGIQEISIDFGINEIVQSGDGEVWPTFAAIGRRQPVITFKTTDVEVLNSLGLTGAVQGATDSVVYLKKVEEGGTRVADGTEEHISFTIDEGRITVEDVTADDNDVAVATVKIQPTYDGTNETVVISTAAAIA
jgi:hypothetical protein